MRRLAWVALAYLQLSGSAQAALTREQAVAQALAQLSPYSQALGNVTISAMEVQVAEAARQPKFEAAPGMVVTTPSLNGYSGNPYSYVSASGVLHSTSLIRMRGELDTSGALAEEVARTDALRRAAQAGSLVARQNLVLNTEQAFYTLALAQAKVNSSRLNLGTAQDLEKVTGKLLQAGEVPGVDLERARLSVRDRQIELQTNLAGQSGARESLRYLLGSAASVELQATELPDVLPATPNCRAFRPNGPPAGPNWSRSAPRSKPLSTKPRWPATAQRSEAQAFVQEAQISLDNLQNGANVLAQATAEKDVRQAASTLKNARALQQRRQRLYQDGGLALKDLQDSQLAASVAQANYDLSIRSRQLLNAATRPGSVALAQSKLEEARRRVATLSSPLRFGEIRAPISGTVTDQFQYLGEYVTPGAKLLSLADLSEVIVKGQFPDTVLAQLQLGQIAWVRPLDRPELKLKGKITALSAVTDPQSRSGEVWVQLANGDGKLRGGGFCEVAVDTGQHRSLLVPDSALTLDQPEAPQGWLAVVDGQHVAHLRRVTCGLKRNGYTEIVQGLFANELVVTQGNVGLADGTRVSL